MPFTGWGRCFRNIVGTLLLLRCWESEGLLGISSLDPVLSRLLPAARASKGRETLVTLGRWGAADPSKIQEWDEVILCYRHYRESSRAIIKQEKVGARTFEKKC